MWRPLTQTFGKMCPTTTATNIDGDVVPYDEVWEINEISAYNASSENFSLVTKKVLGLVDMPISVNSALGAGYADDTYLVAKLLTAGQKLQVTATGSAAGGVIWLHYTGRIYKLSEGVVCDASSEAPVTSAGGAV